jgi:RNA polymerase sigma-70 factor (ECF subfamily)
MSSEAAAYFANALASVTEEPASVRSEIDAATDLKEKARPLTEERDVPATAASGISKITDEQLLEHVSRGTREALALLFRRHARSVRNVAQRILRDEAEADDLLQEVFLYIFRKATLFDTSQGSARTWIFHLTYHRAFNRRRYLTLRHFYSSQDLDENIVRLDRNLEYGLSMDGIFAKDLMAKFDHHLSKEQRQTIHLYFVEGYSLREIAERTGQTLSNVRNHYYRGLERLRTHAVREKVRSK